MGDAASMNPDFLKQIFLLVVVLSGVTGTVFAMLRKRTIHPQPLRVAEEQRHIDEERYVRDRAEIVARIDHLERTMKRDREALMDEIAAVPHRVIALLKDTKGLL